MFICLRPLPSYDPIYPPSVYVYIVNLLTQGRGVKLTREKVRATTVLTAGPKVSTGLTLSPVYKL